MRIRRNHQWIGMGLILLFLIVGSASALVEISKKAEIRADQDEIDAILYTFDQAEEALQAKNLSVIMTIYSDGYQNRGLRKGDTSRIWQDLFNRYDRLSSHHHFSRIVVDPDGTKAKVTCTGALLGVSVFKKGDRAEPVQIDTWFEANHYLVLEEGAWRIVGHDPSEKERDLFGSAIHLLF
ncbi:MAG: nuclear transport factor 2 family protein [Candidatus Manganitrophus sp.]|nr:nuclear transport factor 2 family protein [Candidatus Manganitrophus sp.]